MHKKTHGATTHSNAFLLVVLGDYLAEQAERIKKNEAAPGSNVIVKWDGHEETVKNPEVYKNKWKGPDAKYKVINNSPYVAVVNLIVQGVPRKLSPEAESHGLKIRRTFRDKDGKILDGDEFKQTENVIVGIHVTATTRAENVVIADLLPAGLEIENPRLAAGSLLKMQLKSDKPGYMDLRDDRLILFYDNLRENQEYHYYYVATPVTPGEFTYPPVQAECMYAPQLRGRSAVTEIEVKE